MENLYFECPVQESMEQVKERFDLELFKALKPPLVNLKVTRFDGCNKGDEVHLSIFFGIPLFQVKWVSSITESYEDDENWYFIDEGVLLPFPLKKWRHKHIVKKVGSSSLIVDDISFSSNNRVLNFMLKPLLKLQFSGRYAIYQKIFGSS